MEENCVQVKHVIPDSNCCGCSACAAVCPKEAIQMGQNESGFYVPHVTHACVDCGKCLQVCQMGRHNEGVQPMSVWAMRTRNEDIIQKSASGGVFMALCQSMFDQYGDEFSCFGAAWSDNLKVIHKEAKTVDECQDFMGSKYVQSDLKDTFRQVAERLRAGKYVLFSGTGCQCAGLQRFLDAKQVDQKRLFMVDVVCHGVPSAKMWRDYLDCLEQKQGAKIVSYTFRDKSKGWGMFPKAIDAQGRQLEKDKLFMSYCRVFGNLALNTPCYQCAYANTYRNGHLTLGDFWGIEKSDCTIPRQQGVSLVLVNTPKGQELLARLEQSMQSQKVEGDCWQQPQLRTPTSRNILCDRFWRDYQSSGYKYIAEKYTGHSKVRRAMMKLMALVSRK